MIQTLINLLIPISYKKVYINILIFSISIFLDFHLWTKESISHINRNSENPKLQKLEIICKIVQASKLMTKVK